MQTLCKAAGQISESFWQPNGHWFYDTVTYGAGLGCKMGGNLLAFRGQIGGQSVGIPRGGGPELVWYKKHVIIYLLPARPTPIRSPEPAYHGRGEEKI